MDITAQRLRKLRLDKELSQNEVAKILGISRTAYDGYNSSKTT
nr:MAG TPA: Helix-turn-helix XRE-family like protein [Caudoviricetes sp.]